MNFDLQKNIWRNLYIHIPYCASKCGYCAFYSETQSSQAMRRRYLGKIVDVLRSTGFTEPVETIYIGGGTPNMLTWQEMEFLFKNIAENVPRTSDCEISCELNPELMTLNKLDLLNEYATRLSLGVQSFDPAVRNTLMRKCSQDKLLEALKLLEKRQTEHFNIDLIYGIAGVDWQVFYRDIEQALQAGVDHLSCYALTPEENSLLGLQAPAADDGNAADWWLKIGETLAAKGLPRYEVSNYARPGCGCRHNINVWRGGTLLGVGAAASGFDGVDRYTYEYDAASFVQGVLPEYDRISTVARMLELWAVNLRTTSGWQRCDWEKIYPGSWDKMYKASCLAAGNDPDWWQVEDDKIALTQTGLLFWDDAAMQVLDWEENW